jgi:hypothetical protein
MHENLPNTQSQQQSVKKPRKKSRKRVLQPQQSQSTSSNPHWACDMCSITRFGSVIDYDCHISGKRHLRQSKKSTLNKVDESINATSTTDASSPATATPANFSCKICKIKNFKSKDDYDSHLNGARHKKNEFLRSKERKTGIKKAQKLFDSLDDMNKLLEKMNQAPETTESKARAALRSTHINIFDLIAENFLRHSTISKLAKYTRKTGKWYPLQQAKQSSLGLKEFLRPLKSFIT